MKRKYWAIAVLALAAAAVCLVLLRPWARPAAGTRVLVDGKEFSSSSSVSMEKKDDLRVYLTLDGKELASFPFSEEHTVQVLQENGDENTLRLTGTSVRMEHANCEGQDCVKMEEVTRDNLETRVMFGMIICLPHRLSVEVR